MIRPCLVYQLIQAAETGLFGCSEILRIWIVGPLLFRIFLTLLTLDSLSCHEMTVLLLVLIVCKSYQNAASAFVKSGLDSV